MSRTTQNGPKAPNAYSKLPSPEASVEPLSLRPAASQGGSQASAAALQRGLTASLFGQDGHDEEVQASSKALQPSHPSTPRHSLGNMGAGSRAGTIISSALSPLLPLTPLISVIPLIPLRSLTTLISAGAPSVSGDLLEVDRQEHSPAGGADRWLYDPLGAFADWLASPSANAGRGFSADSQKVYASMWGKFTRFCVDNGFTPALANHSCLERFMASLAQQRMDKSSLARLTQAARSQDVGGRDRQQRRYLSVIARAHAMLMLFGLRPDNPAAHMLEHCAPEPERPDPSPLRQGGDQRLRSALSKRKASRGFDWRDLRDQAIVEVLIGSGLTSRQLRLLKNSSAHLGLEDSPAWVRPVVARRGQPKPGRLPLSREAAVSLRAWLVVRAERMPGDVLFPATLGGDEMSAASLYRAVSQTLALAQESEDHPVAAHLGPRTLRHTFAMRQLRAGKPLEVLQQWLNHSKPSSTAVYRRLVPDPMGHEPV